ncbi:MAG TPA: hypothetical protein VMZ53_02210 [Kofleriaceae bacterium]|nr:hypothetical protein [Kofleriaceae bacterium]
MFASRALACFMLTAASTASAQAITTVDKPPSRLGLIVSNGIGIGHIGDTGPGDPVFYDYGETSIVHALVVDFGIRINRRLLLGLHGGTVSATKFVDGFSDFLGTHETHYGIRTVQYGMTVELALGEHAWLAPWLGVQDSMSRATCIVSDEHTPRPPDLPCEASSSSSSWEYQWDHRLGGGLGAGYDVYEHGGHRLSVVGALVSSSIKPIPGSRATNVSYTSVSIGLAYRFWQ